MAIQQAQIRNLTVADSLTAISTNFRLDNTVTILDVRRTFLCESASDSAESITLNNGLFLNPINAGISRTEIVVTDSDLTIPTATIDEFDFIFITVSTPTTASTITIPSHATSPQKIITIAYTSGANPVTVSGLVGDDIVMNSLFDTVECRQINSTGSQWVPTLSYTLSDGVPHEWSELNEFTWGVTNLKNKGGGSQLGLYGIEGQASETLYGTVDLSGVVQTVDASIKYDDTDGAEKFTIAADHDIEITTDTVTDKVRVQNYLFPDDASAEDIEFPVLDGVAGDVLRTDGAGNLDFDSALTEEELVDISVNDTYTLTKAIADGRNNIVIRATPEAGGANYTIDTEALINAWTTLKVVYDGSVTNGTITVAPTSYIHGPTEFYLQKHGDYGIFQKTNSISGSFWTFMGGQCEHNGNTSDVGLYSSNMYDRLRGQSVETSLTAALDSAKSSKITKAVADIGKANGVAFTNSEAVSVFNATLGLNTTVIEGTRSVWNSGTNAGFAIFCSGTIADPTNPSNDLGQIIIPANELTANGELYITRSSSSGSNPRQLWVHVGDPEAGGQELIPFLGSTVHTSQSDSSTVAFKVSLDDSTLPSGDLYLSFAKQFIKDITLVNNDIGGRTVSLENSSHEITNSDRSALVTVGEDGGVLIASTSASSNISTITLAEDKLVLSNSGSAPQTDVSLATDNTYTGTNKQMSLGDFSTLDLSPTSPIDPDIDIQFTGVNATFNGDPGGIPEIVGYAWNQSGQISTNYTQYTISNIPAGAIVQVFFTGYVFGGDTDVRVDPYLGFTSSTVQNVTMTGSTPAEYSSTLLTTNATTVGIRLRGNNVTPYKEVRFEVTQDFPIATTPDPSELFGMFTTDKGVGFPRVDSTNITTPSDYLLIRDTTDGNRLKQYNPLTTVWERVKDEVVTINASNNIDTDANIAGTYLTYGADHGSAPSGDNPYPTGTSGSSGAVNLITIGSDLQLGGLDDYVTQIAQSCSTTVNPTKIRTKTNGTYSPWEVIGGYNEVSQSFSIGSTTTSGAWYRIATFAQQPSSTSFMRDMSVHTTDGTHATSADFTVGARVRIPDGTAAGNYWLDTMHMKHRMGWQYEQGGLNDDPIRGIRFVDEGNGGSNSIIHIDILMWQDSGSSTTHVKWLPTKISQEVATFHATPEKNPDTTGHTVKSYDLQGFTERQRDSYGVKFNRSNGQQYWVDLVNGETCHLKLKGQAAGGVALQRGTFDQTVTMTQTSTGQYTYTFPTSAEFPFPANNDHMFIQVSQNTQASGNDTYAGNAYWTGSTLVVRFKDHADAYQNCEHSLSIEW